MIVKNPVILKLVFVSLTALMIPMACGRYVEEAETVALQYLEACRDGDESTLAGISIVEKPLTAFKWKRITAGVPPGRPGDGGGFQDGLVGLQDERLDGVTG